MEDFDILKTIGLVAAGCYFLWKVIAGWLVINLEIAIETERQEETPELDLLAFKILFKKGNTDTLNIKDIQARVYGEGVEKPEVFEFSEITKLALSNHKITWSDNPKGTKISLSPSESLHLGRFTRVLAKKPVIVEAVIHGTRRFWGIGFQWRASVVSLPPKKEAKE
ncbi:MAG: hypothetical protein ACK4NY_08245 [Spirosomataceae bacterium]